MDRLGDLVPIVFIIFKFLFDLNLIFDFLRLLLLECGFWVGLLGLFLAEYAKHASES